MKAGSGAGGRQLLHSAIASGPYFWANTLISAVTLLGVPFLRPEPGRDLLDEIVERAANFTIVDSARSFDRSGGTGITAFETCRVARYTA